MYTRHSSPLCWVLHVYYLMHFTHTHISLQMCINSWCTHTLTHTHTHTCTHTTHPHHHPHTHTYHPPPTHTHTHSPPPPLLLLESVPHWTLHERRAVSASPSPLLRPVRETIAPPLAVTARVMWQGCTQCTMLCPAVPLLRPGTKPTLLARCVCAYWDGEGNFDVAIQRSVFDRSLCQFVWLISGQSNRQFRRLNRRKVLAFPSMCISQACQSHPFQKVDFLFSHVTNSVMWPILSVMWPILSCDQFCLSCDQFYLSCDQSASCLPVLQWCTCNLTSIMCPLQQDLCTIYMYVCMFLF